MQGAADLLILRLAHSPENPYDPAAVCHFRDISELPLRPLGLARTLAKEELQEPLRHVKETQVVLL